MGVSSSFNVLTFIFVKVKIMANDIASLERAKAIISGLTMVPAVGDIYRHVFLCFFHLVRNLHLESDFSLFFLSGIVKSNQWLLMVPL